MHETSCGELLTEDGAKQRRTAEPADLGRPAPSHPAVFEEEPLHARWWARNSSVVPWSRVGGRELVEVGVDPRDERSNGTRRSGSLPTFDDDLRLGEELDGV